MIWNMSAGTDFQPPFTRLDTSYNKDNVPTVKDELLEHSANLKQMSTGKPLRHLSSIWHSISTATLSPPSNLDLDPTVPGTHSPSDGKSSLLQIFRSGCCGDGGPKQYMGDEHICIDNLLEHLSETAGFPSPGAFYGVSDWSYQLLG